MRFRTLDKMNYFEHRSIDGTDLDSNYASPWASSSSRASSDCFGLKKTALVLLQFCISTFFKNIASFCHLFLIPGWDAEVLLNDARKQRTRFIMSHQSLSVQACSHRARLDHRCSNRRSSSQKWKTTQNKGAERTYSRLKISMSLNLMTLNES